MAYKNDGCSSIFVTLGIIIWGLVEVPIITLVIVGIIVLLMAFWFISGNLKEKERQRQLEWQKQQEFLNQQQLEKKRQEQEKIEQLKRIEQQRIESLKYETVTVVFAYIEDDGKPNAIVKRSNNTYEFIHRTGKSPSQYIIGESLKLLKETTNTWNWVNEQEYKKRELIKRQRATYLQEQRQAAEQIKLEQLYATYKSNWQDFHKVLQAKGITKFYHFTDSANLQSIRENRGLYSWDYCQRNDIDIPRPGGDELSWALDQRKGLQNYVRVSFVKDHPMLFVAKTEGRIINPIILEISLDIIFKKETKFTTQNAARNGVMADTSFERFNSIKFPIVRKRYFDLTEEEKPFYQAEVLVLENIPIECITNINEV